MKNLDNLKRQHLDIYEIVAETKELMKKSDFDMHSKNVAMNINVLAGKLKMHLINEDKFLYPTFLSSDDDKLSKKAKEYIEEMGDLSEVYTEFKSKYNVRSKIMVDIPKFMKEANSVFDAIEKRMNKEDNDLYVLAEKL
ncbi:hemerythrin domain-containing protein [Clostridiaceae bacterium HSG29]|nr:hemerythrin domain-containing protein [Clostridiaceae bacterium HSG29]